MLKISARSEALWDEAEGILNAAAVHVNVRHRKRLLFSVPDLPPEVRAALEALGVTITEDAQGYPDLERSLRQEILSLGAPLVSGVTSKPDRVRILLREDSPEIRATITPLVEERFPGREIEFIPGADFHAADHEDVESARE